MLPLVHDLMPSTPSSVEIRVRSFSSFYPLVTEVQASQRSYYLTAKMHILGLLLFRPRHLRDSLGLVCSVLSPPLPLIPRAHPWDKCDTCSYRWHFLHLLPSSVLPCLPERVPNTVCSFIHSSNRCNHLECVRQNPTSWRHYSENIEFPACPEPQS